MAVNKWEISKEVSYTCSPVATSPILSRLSITNTPPSSPNNKHVTTLSLSLSLSLLTARRHLRHYKSWRTHKCYVLHITIDPCTRGYTFPRPASTHSLCARVCPREVRRSECVVCSTVQRRVYGKNYPYCVTHLLSLSHHDYFQRPQRWIPRFFKSVSPFDHIEILISH